MHRRSISTPALLLVIPALTALACDDDAGAGQASDARPADAADAADGADVNSDSTGDQAPAAPLSLTKILDHRILGAI